LRSRHEGQGSEGGWGFSTGELLDALGPATLVQIVAIDGDLRILVCSGARVRHVRGGRADEAATEVGFARFGLRRLAHGRGAGPDGAALATLEASGRRLEAILLGPAARLLGSGPVVVVPPGRLHAVPWALLPSLRRRPVSVAPSAAAWLRAVRTEPPRRRDVTLVVGPGLGTGGAEVPLLAQRHPGATVLGNGTAT